MTERNGKPTHWGFQGMVFGIGAGGILAMAFDNWPLGLLLGVAVGVVFAAASRE